MVSFQANAVSDQVLDLRKCVYSGKDLSGKTLAGALMSDADLTKANLQEAILTKVRQLSQMHIFLGSARSL